MTVNLAPNDNLTSGSGSIILQTDPFKNISSLSDFNPNCRKSLVASQGIHVDAVTIIENLKRPQITLTNSSLGGS